MREVAKIVCHDRSHFPAVVLSAMGKTTNLLLAAGEAALQASSPEAAGAVSELSTLRANHHRACEELGVSAEVTAEVGRLLGQLQQLLVGVNILNELTPRARDQLVSFGERMSVRIFAGYLNAQGVAARPVDAFDAGVVTDDAFTNAEVDYAKTLPALRKSLHLAPRSDNAKAGAPHDPSAGARRALPIVTGFLGRGATTGAITTLGRGGSDLTCTLLGAALRLPEVQVWKDVDGVLTGDPRVLPLARPVPSLTYDEASELAFFGATVLHPYAMHPARYAAREGHALAVRVKNSYNVDAPGTKIAAERDSSSSSSEDESEDAFFNNATEAQRQREGHLSSAVTFPSSSSASSPCGTSTPSADGTCPPPTRGLMTSLVLKRNVTLFDIVSSNMMGQVGFLSRVFDVFARHRVSVDVVATSEVSVSLTLDPAKTVWQRDLVDEELEALSEELKGFADVSFRRNVSIVCLICDVTRTSIVLERVFDVLRGEDVHVLMMSQGASKNNISLVILDDEAERALKALHKEFFE